MKIPTISRLTLIAVVGVMLLAYDQRTFGQGEYRRVGSFSIQMFPKSSGDWFEAATTCALKAEGRLCRPAEWIAACRVRAFQSGGAPEWVDQITPEEGFGKSEGFRALAMFSSCDRGVWLPSQRESLPVRCCRDGIGRF